MASDSAATETSKQEATDGVVKTEWLESCKQLKTESKEARELPQLSWNTAWNLYNGYYDFSNKAEWQSKNALWRVNNAVRSATYLLKSGLTGQKDFFQTEGYGEVGKQIAPFVHLLAKFHMQTGGFVPAYKTALMSGLLSSLVILKIYPELIDQNSLQFWNRGRPARPHEPEEGINMIGNILGSKNKFKSPKKHLSIRYEPVSAFDMYLDPHGENLFKIHEIQMDLHTLKEMAKNPKNNFDPDVIKQITEDFVKADQESQENSRKGQDNAARPSFRKRVQLDEMWGTLVSTDGEVLFRNVYAVMVNEKYPLVAPRPNPMAGGIDPFVIAPVIEKPFSTWHQNFVDSVAGIQVMMTELLNLFSDGNLFASIKAFEIDVDQVYDPNEFINGIYPGKTFKRQSSQAVNAGPMIRDIQIGNLAPQNEELYTLLDREFRAATGLDDSLVGQPRVRTGRITAQESSQRQQGSMSFFAEIARDQEEGIIEPALYKTYLYLIHYQTNWEDPFLIELMGEGNVAKAKILLSNPDIKDFMTSGPVLFKATGMTQIMNRAKELEKIMAFMQVTGNLAKAMPQILERIDVLKIFEKAIYALNWNPSEVIKDDGIQDPTGTPPIPPAPGVPPQPGTGGVPNPGSMPAPDLNLAGVHGVNGNGGFPIT